MKNLLDSGDPVYLLDVREPEEHAVARIDGAELIPMGSIPANLQAIEAKGDDARVIVFCHHGVRSLNVVAWLRQHGVDECQSMAGGIDLWSAIVDLTVPRY